MHECYSLSTAVAGAGTAGSVLDDVGGLSNKQNSQYDIPRREYGHMSRLTVYMMDGECESDSGCSGRME